MLTAASLRHLSHALIQPFFHYPWLERGLNPPISEQCITPHDGGGLTLRMNIINIPQEASPDPRTYHEYRNDGGRAT